MLDLFGKQDDKNPLDEPDKSDKSEATEALGKMQSEISDIRVSGVLVNAEMSKVKVVCYPPPITPPCRIEELPADPAAVNAAMQEMRSSESGLKNELDNLHQDADKFPKDFGRELEKMQKQNNLLDKEIEKLNKLTSSKSFDKDKIIRETRSIEKLGAELEKTRLQLERSLDH